MVNKCSVARCKSLYVKQDNVKLHRFPLNNAVTLPMWIAVTGKQNGWMPCKSSRLCGNHFHESEYIVGHGKGVLKPTAIPTIDYHMDTPQKFRKNKYSNLHEEMGQINTLIKDEPMDDYTNVEIAQPIYNDIYDSECEYGNNNLTGTNINHEESCYQNEYEEVKEEKKYDTNSIVTQHQNFANLEDNQIEEDDSNYYETTQNEYETQNSNFFDIKNICNRENQCYMFTSSFKESAEPPEPIVLTPPDDKPFEEPLNVKIEKSKAELYFKKIMALKLKKARRTKDIYSLYFKALRKRQEKETNAAYNDTGSFGAFIEAQMNELRPNKKLYLTTKHKIQKLIMNAQRQID